MTDRFLLGMLALMLGSALLIALHFLDSQIDSSCDGTLICDTQEGM